MNNINFDEGYKEFQINNDPNRVLRFNPRDMAFVEKLDNAKKEFQKLQNEIKDKKEDVETITMANNKVRKIVDDIFYEGANQIIFGAQHPLTFIGGKTIFERFIEALGEIMKPYIEKENKLAEKRMKKYTDVYKNQEA